MYKFGLNRYFVFSYTLKNEIDFVRTIGIIDRKLIALPSSSILQFINSNSSALNNTKIEL